MVEVADGRRAIVVGAGIAGLSAAFRLQQRGFDVRVLEAEADIGGRMSSVEVDGFTMNRAANILPASYDVIRGLAADVGLGDQLEQMHGRIGTLRNGQVHRLRSDHLVGDALRTKLIPWRSKRRSLSYENLGQAAPFDTETAAAYIDRRLDPELGEYVVEPVLRALYTAEAERLSKVDFFFAALNLVGSGFLRYPGGIDFLVRALAARLDVRTGARVETVARDGRAVLVRWHEDGGVVEERVDACVIAVVGCAVPALYPELDPVQRRILSEDLQWCTTFNAHFGLSVRPDEPCMIVQVPASEDPGLCVVTFDHNSSPTVAPPGKGKLASYWLHSWCEERLDRTDDELIDEMLPSVDKVLPGVAGIVETTRIDRWRPSVVMSRPGTYAAMDELVRRIDPTSPVQLAGDFMTASSTNGCALSGELAAQRLATSVSLSTALGR
jgi:oxygen-dependent protoporphyrinogen oxidase